MTEVMKWKKKDNNIVCAMLNSCMVYLANVNDVFQ